MANLWLAVVLLCLTMYVILDGYDLGIGTVMLLERRRDRQREMVEVVATTWDGNETWLILLGVALWGGFPQAYAVVLPHVYLPLITMLLALIARGVSIEMISAAEGTPRRWTGAFAVGSLLAAFAQGVVFGALTESVPLINGRYAGSALDVIAPYPLLTGVAAVLLYATLGAGYLRLKSDGPLRNEASQRGRVLVGLTASMSIVVALFSGRTGAQLSAHTPWRTAGFFALVLLACVAAVVAAVGFSRPVAGTWAEGLPFLATCAAVITGLVAVTVARYPVLLPPDLTVSSTAAPSVTQMFLIIGVGANIPVVLFYSWYAHHVFRGKYRVPPSIRPAEMSAAAAALRPSRPVVTAPHHDGTTA